MSSHACATQRLLPLVAAAIFSLSACDNSTPLASVEPTPTPTPGVDEPKTPVMRCAPPLLDGSVQLVQADCIETAEEQAS